MQTINRIKIKYITETNRLVNKTDSVEALNISLSSLNNIQKLLNFKKLSLHRGAFSKRLNVNYRIRGKVEKYSWTCFSYPLQ